MIDSYGVEPASVSVITRYHSANNRIFFEGDENQVVDSPLGGDHLTRVVMRWIIWEYALPEGYQRVPVVILVGSKFYWKIEERCPALRQRKEFAKPCRWVFNNQQYNIGYAGCSQDEQESAIKQQADQLSENQVSGVMSRTPPAVQK